MEYVYRIQHKPTRLYYGSTSGTLSNTKTDLSTRGKFYVSEKTAKRALETDIKYARANEAQIIKYYLPLLSGRTDFTRLDQNDFEIVAFELVEV